MPITGDHLIGKSSHNFTPIAADRRRSHRQSEIKLIWQARHLYIGLLLNPLTALPAIEPGKESLETLAQQRLARSVTVLRARLAEL